MKALIDTCVILDALKKRVPFFENAKAVFFACTKDGVEGYITAKALTDIHYLYHKETHDEAITRERIFSLLYIFSLLDTTAEDCRMALFSDTSDYEDALMIQTASSYGMDCIVTRNLYDYKKSRIPVYSPDEFLERIH